MRQPHLRINRFYFIMAIILEIISLMKAIIFSMNITKSDFSFGSSGSATMSAFGSADWSMRLSYSIYASSLFSSSGVFDWSTFVRRSPALSSSATSEASITQSWLQSAAAQISLPTCSLVKCPFTIRFTLYASAPSYLPSPSTSPKSTAV